MAVGADGTVLASDESNGGFTIVAQASTGGGGGGGSTTPPPSGSGTQLDGSGSFDPNGQAMSAPTINDDEGLTVPMENPPCVSNTLIKTAASSAVYYCGKDGKRYVFPNDKVYFTWYADFSGVITISSTAMALIPLGGNVQYKPGVRMIKIQSDLRVYAVAKGGILRWVPDEETARALYGIEWNKKIDDVSVALFGDYKMGPPVPSVKP